MGRQPPELRRGFHFLSILHENIPTKLEISMAASRRNSHSVAFFAVRKYALIDEPSVGLSPSIGLKVRRDDRI